jgi:hypothetical protein
VLKGIPKENEIMSEQITTETAWKLFTHDQWLKGNPDKSTHVVLLQDMTTHQDEGREIALEEGESFEIISWSAVQPDGSFRPIIHIASSSHPEPIHLDLEVAAIRRSLRFCTLREEGV